MKWTTKKPDRPGWWWCRELDYVGGHERPKAVHVDKFGFQRDGERWLANYDGHGYEGLAVSYEGVDELWSDEPIPEPEESGNEQA